MNLIQDLYEGSTSAHLLIRTPQRQISIVGLIFYGLVEVRLREFCRGRYNFVLSIYTHALSYFIVYQIGFTSIAKSNPNLQPSGRNAQPRTINHAGRRFLA